MEAKRKRYQYQNRTSYIDGNTARKRDFNSNYALQDYSAAPDIKRRQIPEPRRQVRKNPKALSGINKGSLLVLTMAIAVTLYFCIEFLMLQHEVSKMEKDIKTMERTLTIKRNENDAAYEQINMVYDLDYVYQIAVGELGMVYPNNNEVITYDKPDESYVRQYADIPD